MTNKLLTKHSLEFLSLKGGCTGSSESTLVKMPHCWKSQVTAQLYIKRLPVEISIKSCVYVPINRFILVKSADSNEILP